MIVVHFVGPETHSPIKTFAMTDSEGRPFIGLEMEVTGTFANKSFVSFGGKNYYISELKGIVDSYNVLKTMVAGAGVL